MHLLFLQFIMPRIFKDPGTMSQELPQLRDSMSKFHFCDYFCSQDLCSLCLDLTLINILNT